MIRARFKIERIEFTPDYGANSRVGAGAPTVAAIEADPLGIVGTSIPEINSKLWPNGAAGHLMLARLDPSGIEGLKVGDEITITIEPPSAKEGA